jgi:N,N'-diacetyllegionaminate synthase
MNKVVIIAEAGVNHNGSLETAIKLVDVAAAAGADYVKFQTFIADNMTVASAPKAGYQLATTSQHESQIEMLKKLQLSAADHDQIFKHCQLRGIKFLSTAFDSESFNFLKKYDMDYVKIPSGEITNLPFLRQAGALGKKIILSTGMANLAEIAGALAVLQKAGAVKAGITVLHCNTEYPTPMEDVNLKAMLQIAAEFSVKVGYSDHTLGTEVPVAAVALGACMIEKHFTLDRSLPGPDHRASLEPNELAVMVAGIRNIERALGDGVKKPSASEDKNKLIARKSIVALRAIKSGEVFSEKNLTTKRPAAGISPMLWDSLIGKKASKDYSADELIAEPGVLNANN